MVGLPGHHLAAGLAGHPCISADPREREDRRRRLPHHSIAADERPRNPRSGSFGQPISHHALRGPRGSQSQRRALRLLGSQWARNPCALHHRLIAARLARHSPGSRWARDRLVWIGHCGPSLCGSAKESNHRRSSRPHPNAGTVGHWNCRHDRAQGRQFTGRSLATHGIGTCTRRPVGARSGRTAYIDALGSGAGACHRT